MENFWDGREVYDEALTKCVGAIRKALEESSEKPRFIETRWAEGYRFIGQVNETLFAQPLVEIKKRETEFVIEESDESGAPEDKKDTSFDALRAIRRAQELDPLSSNIGTDVGVMLTHLKRCDEAVEVLKKTIEADPQFADAYWNLERAYERKGDYPRVVAAFLDHERLNGTNEKDLDALRAAFERGGIKGFWRRQLDFAKRSSGKSISHNRLATLYARLGEREDAINSLELAFAAREPIMLNLKSEYVFDSLRSDARFVDLLRRMKLE